MGYYKKSKDASGQYRFALKAGNNETILTSESYKSAQGCDNGIASVQKNCINNNRYENKTATNGKFYFVLKAANGEIIGTSQMYGTEAARDKGKQSVMSNGSSKDVRE